MTRITHQTGQISPAWTHYVLVLGGAGQSPACEGMATGKERHAARRNQSCQNDSVHQLIRLWSLLSSDRLPKAQVCADAGTVLDLVVLVSHILLACRIHVHTINVQYVQYAWPTPSKITM